MKLFFPVLIGAICLNFGFHAAEVVLPQKRSAYYVDQAIELAVHALADGEQVTVMLVSEGKEPVSFAVAGDGQTQLLRLPPNSLAPGEYRVMIGEEQKATLHISRGVHSSTMYVSQTGGGHKNFSVSNAFNFGLTDPKDRTMPTADPRSKSMLTRYDDLIKEDIPGLIYMYWTGYVLHKPWGVHKEWASADIIENMRLFNYHVAQRMRRYDDMVLFIGSLDEPGLPWGRTASGGSASGFAGWNVQEWIEERGGVFTLDPGSLPDDEFRTYMQLRALMLREAFQQASDDIKEVWPSAVYSTDSYAPQAVGDGTDPMNQIANDVPSTHVFADYGIGKLGVLAGMYIEKAHDPTSKVAHAMNGQLFGDRVPHPGSLHAYYLMQNVMLASGLKSNWWLNFTGLGIGEDEEGRKGAALREANLERINEPAERMGPLFVEMVPSDHDVAVLWSTSEIWMRVKGVMKVEASNADGEQKALMVADLPEDAIGEDGKLKYNAYSVGGNYKGEVMSTFMAVNRAGYPAHVLHEDLIPAGKLDNYKVLVMVHQTHELPADKRAAIEAWIAGGGTLIQDASCTVAFEGAMRVDAPSVVDQGYAWQTGFAKARASDDPMDETYYSNHFMESFSRDATAAFREVLARTEARQVMKTETNELACERHVGGDAELLMVINGYEELPESLEDGEKVYIWNYAPYEATYTLPTIDEGDTVYLIEGLDWKTVSKVDNPTAPQRASFAPGEMKLYLVVPRAPEGLALNASLADGEISLDAGLGSAPVPAQTLHAPWPLHVTIANPAGEAIVSIYRNTDAQGIYSETIPLGKNAPAGEYTVTISSPIGGLQAAATLAHTPVNPVPESIAATVRVFDGETIQSFLAGKPTIRIALADEAHRATAERLVAGLTETGISVEIAPERELYRKALYPRVWDPYAPLVVKSDTTKELPEVQKLDERGRPMRDDANQIIMIPGTVEQELIIESDSYDTPTLTTTDGTPFTGKWNQQGSLLTVGPNGYIDRSGRETFYEPGVRIFYLDGRRKVALNGETTEVKTDAAFRQKWARPWKQITGHVGGHNLTPQLPEVFATDHHLILLGDSQDGMLVRALQASELLLQVVDEAYPGPGKALVQYAWSPFALEKNVIYIGATDAAGLAAGAEAVLDLVQ